MENNNTYCVIMAGGVGSRFWPRSRTDCPKQFLDILGTGSSLLQQTWSRFAKICSPENILIVTGEQYTQTVLMQLPDVLPDNVLSEPLRRNTAPCIAYACYKIHSKNPDANIVVSPSDHFIGDEGLFIDTIKSGLNFTYNNDVLLTIGIKPIRPETGYGYIQIDSQIFDNVRRSEGVIKVKTFTEKPEIEMARVFMESGEFFWNSGIFIWNAKAIVKSFENYMPETASMFASGNSKYNTPDEIPFIKNIYPECNSISIDYGIMEAGENVYVLPAKFAWSDLGTWGSLYENSEKDVNGNVSVGKNIIALDSTGCIFNTSDSKLCIVDGLKDYIVAEADGMILIIPKSKEQNIKQIVTEVKLNLGDDFV